DAEPQPDDAEYGEDDRSQDVEADGWSRRPDEYDEGFGWRWGYAKHDGPNGWYGGHAGHDAEHGDGPLEDGRHDGQGSWRSSAMIRGRVTLAVFVVVPSPSPPSGAAIISTSLTLLQKLHFLHLSST
ncbi:hypothetical protein FOZ63_015272, partial [Perkinsus olseni]